MLGFSLQKLLLLAAIIAAVWYAFKFIGQLDRARKEERLRGGGKKPRGWNLRSGSGEAGRKQARDKPPPPAEELVQCWACKSYVPAKSARSCGRDDCPYL
jgi:uncharacterized protein